MSLLDPGKRAPTFTLRDQNGQPWKLADAIGRPIVLYFYPKDDTTACTAEACGFRDALPDFSALDAVVVGVSPDDEGSHARFVEKHGLPFTLLSDPGAIALEKYGVWQEKSMYGRSYMGVVRTTYLIGTDGKVARRWDRVSVDGHATEVLDAVRSLDRQSATRRELTPTAKQRARGATARTA